MCAVLTKGDSRRKSYELMMAREKNLGIDEIMSYRIFDVHEILDEVDREEMGNEPTGESKPFYEYLETMLC